MQMNLGKWGLTLTIGFWRVGAGIMKKDGFTHHLLREASSGILKE